MRTLQSLVFVGVLAVPALSFAQAAAPAADALGTWNASFNTQNGVIPAVLKLEKSGDKITGTIGSAEGTSPVEAQIKGNALTVWFNYQSNGNAIPIEMTGTIDGDSAKGAMTAGGSPAGDWTAKRDKAAKDTTEPKTPASPSPSSGASLAGTWNLTLTLDTITATPSLTLKQEGDKLTGEYVSQQYGKFPVTGTVTGTALSFTVPLNIEGNAITATYNGTVQSDGSIKGTVAIGDAMSGSFTGTRKQ